MEKVLLAAIKALENGQPCALATVVESAKGTPQKIGAKMVVFRDGTCFGTVGGGLNEEKTRKECLKAIKNQKHSLVPLSYSKKDGFLCGGQIKVFVEPIAAQKSLIICGAGHIGLPLSIIGKTLDFKVTVLDNRKAFANKKRFPHVDKIICDTFDKGLSKVSANQNTFVVIVTAGHAYDFQCLKKIIHSKAAYIGIICSQSKKQEFIKKLHKSGIANDLIKRIKMPIGLDIGALSPQEIAVSIAAEIVSIYNHDLVGSAKFSCK
ncbi:MAG: XdhC/CoxI family protein [Candidatus Omnitrophota bacterium]|jgi:xanthine dehydrogenase accessory factor